jgi:hypothetical protein
LLNENKRNLNNLKEQRLDIKNAGLSVQTVTMSDPTVFKPGFCQAFLGGRVIIFTLHCYFGQRGDFYNYSDLFYALFSQRANVVMFVDEAQLPLKQVHKTVPLTRLVHKKDGDQQLIKNSKRLETVVFETQKERKPLVDSIQKLGREIIKTAVFFEGVYMTDAITNQYLPNRGLDLSRHTPFTMLNDSVYEQILEKGKDPLGELELPKLPDLGPAPIDPTSDTSEGGRVFYESASSIPKVEDYSSYVAEEKTYTALSLNNFDPNTAPYKIFPLLPVFEPGSVEILKDNVGEPIITNWPYYTVAPLALSQDEAVEGKIKRDFLKKYMCVLNYNASLSLLKGYDTKNFEALKEDLRKPPLQGSVVDGPVVMNKLTNYFFAMKDDLVQLFTQNWEKRNAGTRGMVDFNPKLEEFIEGLSEQFADTIYILYELLLMNQSDWKNGKRPFDMVAPTSEEMSFASMLLLSQQTYLVFHYPKYKNQEGAPKHETSFEKFLEVLKEWGRERAELAAKDGLKKSPPFPFTFSSEAPFCFNFVSFSLQDVFVMQRLKKVVLLSATHSELYLNQMQNAFPKAVFPSFESERPPLDLLVLVESSQDMFSSHQPEWKEGWQQFAAHYNTEFISGKDDDARKFCLLLLASNAIAEKWFKMAVSKPSDYFTAITASDERDSQDLVSHGEFNIDPGSYADRATIRSASILSTVSVGLNMPNHPFLIISAANYIPTSFLWLYGNVRPNDSKAYVNIQAQLQAIGRIARRTPFETRTKAFTGRVVVLSNSKRFAATARILAMKEAKKYKNVIILNLDNFNRQLSTKLKKAFSLENFENLVNILEKSQLLKVNPTSFFIAKNKEQYRFELLKRLTGYFQPGYCIQEHLADNIRFLFQG